MTAYRRNVGIALFNAQGLVLIGRRFKDDGPEFVLPGLEWQMPQGGVDDGETPLEAMRRELWEETGVRSAVLLAQTDWLTYDFEPFDDPTHRFAKFRGQRQKWFALRFTGATTPRSIRWRRATASPQNSTPGAGSGSIASPVSWCRSGARFI